MRSGGGPKRPPIFSRNAGRAAPSGQPPECTGMPWPPLCHLCVVWGGRSKAGKLQFVAEVERERVRAAAIRAPPFPAPVASVLPSRWCATGYHDRPCGVAILTRWCHTIRACKGAVCNSQALAQSQPLPGTPGSRLAPLAKLHCLAATLRACRSGLCYAFAGQQACVWSLGMRLAGCQ